MKRQKVSLLALTALLLAGCGTASSVSNKEPVLEKEESMTESTIENTNEDAIKEAIQQETSKVGDEVVSLPEEEADTDRVPTAEIDTTIPVKYINLRFKEAGTIQDITYTSKDYFGDGKDVEKKAHVYLPYGYDESKEYSVLYLMHGIGGDEDEWGMNGSSSKVKTIMDNLSYYGDIDSFIVVTPNGRSATNHAKDSDYNSFYCFGEELRNDLIPYIDSHYSTIADRDHRAMAGLSMGGMQTINIGIGECIDLFGYFGAFSAAPTSNPATKTAEILADNTLPIHYFYNICGTEDGIAYASSSTAAKNLPEVCDQFQDGENFMWQELPGAHDFNIWYLGFYNFAQIAFK